MKSPAETPQEDAAPPQPLLFPIQRQPGAKAHRLRIPWSVAEKAYSVYSAKFGTSQSLERMAERGGFCPDEMDDFHPTWREESDEIFALKAELIALRAQPPPFLAAPDGRMDIQRHLLVMLIRDFGYDHEPLYGHTPMRHQFAWKLATAGVQSDVLAETIAAMKAQAANDGEPFMDYSTRAALDPLVAAAPERKDE